MEMDWFELYKQRLPSGSTQASATGGAQEVAPAAFVQPTPPPMMLAGLGGEIINSRTPGVMVRNPEYVHGSAAVPTMMQVPGGWLVEPGVAWAAAAEEDPLMLGGGDYMFLGNGDGGKLMHRGGDSGFPDLAGGYTDGSLLDCVDWTEFFHGAADSLTYQPAIDNSLLTTNQQASVVVGPSGAIICSPPTPPAYDQANDHQPGSNSSGLTQARATDDSPGPASSPLGAYPHAPAAAPDSEVALMVRVAAECGADKASSTVWSQEEDQLLLQGLSLFADQDNVIKCFSIASGLAKKTTLDVAYRIRWLLDLEKKKEAAKRAELGQKISAGEKVTKGKGAKGSNKKNKKCPLSVSEEDLNSKSTEDLKRDNNRLLDRIEDILRTGKFKDIPDYFYRVKMNMDALNKKVSDSATIMGGVSVDEEEWEDVLRDRSSSKFHQAGN